MGEASFSLSFWVTVYSSRAVLHATWLAPFCLNKDDILPRELHIQLQ
jgi:hypothetical protein